MSNYKRLTDKDWHKEKFYPTTDSERVIRKRLWDLENKIEQGKMIELPCKVGDTVYIVYSFSGICEWEVDEIVIMQRTSRMRLTHRGTKDFNFALLTERGETLFFTREEAEKRLKELRNG